MSTPDQKAKELFLNLIREFGPEHWDSRLVELCGDDQELSARVRALLRAHREPESYLEKPACDFEKTVEHVGPVEERAGARIGRYKLLQQIGEGGMGVVFMAEQSEPVERRIALKIVKPGMDTRQVIARFEVERQALALMDHPNIARVLDAGATEAGRPYFVMELVKGVSITRYCDERRLTPRERLELFVPVCQAIQHAHLKGVIHRDLKPSNVLIAAYDGKPVPKIIDFGVAKATGPKLTEKTMFTEFGSVVGTLEYMSPEQAELNQLDIDTRSDVYSLGVLLYELLTGSTPLEHERVMATVLHEVLRFIREEEPPKPSTRLSSSSDLSAVASNRGTEPARLQGVVSGELDWIVMKSLEKDRRRRYESASALSADLQRYLSNKAVEACPPSAAYALKKFIRRHRGPVAASVALAAAITLGGIGTTIGMFEAFQASQKLGLANEQLQATNQQLASSNVAITRERNEKTEALRRAESNFQLVLQVIDRSLESVGDQTLADVPQLGELRKKLLYDAVAFDEKLLTENPADPAVRFAAARAQVRAADINQRFAYWQDAIRSNDSAITALEALLKLEPTNASYRAELANALKQRSWNAMAIPSSPREDAARARRAVDLFQGLSDEFPTDENYQASLLEAILTLDVWSATTAEKQSLLARMLPLAAPPNMSKRLKGETKNRIAALLTEQGHLDEAEAAYREAIRLHREGVEEHPTEALARAHLIREYNRLGNLLNSRGNREEAVRCFGESFEVGLGLRRDFPAMKHFDQFTLEAVVPLVQGLQSLGRVDEANEALAKWDIRSFVDCIIRGMAYFKLGQFANAVSDFSEATLRTPGQPEVGLMWRGRTRYKLGDYTDALADYQAAIDENPDYWEPYNAEAWLLAAAHEKQLRDGMRAVELATKACKLTGYKNPDCVATLAAAYAEAGDFQKAIDWAHKAIGLAGNNHGLANVFAHRLANYEVSRPWRIADYER